MESEQRINAIVELEKQYLLQNYGRYPLALDRGRGSHVYGFDGKRYLDLLAGIGVTALGHGHPRIVKAIREQSARMIHCSNLYYHEFQGRLAERVCKASGLQRVFFANSGTETVEGAIKMMRSHGHRINPEGKHEIVAFDNSFHGRSCGALSLTGQPKYRKDFEPLLPGVKFVPMGDDDALRAAVGPNTAGIILEVIQGEGGIYPIAESTLRLARELADQHDALLAFDEIQCGMGRAGKYFAYQTYDPPVMPDIMVTAKPLAVGLPLGVIAANERAAASIAAGMHGSTFGGGVLATRVALETFDVLDTLFDNIRARSAQFKAGLDKLASKHACVKEVRVFGLMIGLELHHECKRLVNDAMEAGLLINCTHDTVLRLLPPFTISEAEVSKALRGLDKILRKFQPN
jgi:predicted acetylornithine/succinylornithine family transaminase